MRGLFVLALLAAVIGLAQAKVDMSSAAGLSGAYGKLKYWGPQFRASFYSLQQRYHQSRDVALESKNLAMQSDDMVRKLIADPNPDLAMQIIDKIRVLLASQQKAAEESANAASSFTAHDEKMVGFLTPRRKERDGMLDRIKELRVDTKMPEEARQITLNELQDKYIDFKAVLGRAESSYASFHQGQDALIALDNTCKQQSLDLIDKANSLQADPSPSSSAIANVVTLGLGASTACVKSTEQAMRFTDAFIKALESDKEEVAVTSTSAALTQGNKCALKASRKAALAAKLAKELEATANPLPSQIKKAAVAAQAAAKAAAACADVANQAAVAVAADLEAVKRKKEDMLAAGFASCDQSTKDTLRRRNTEITALAALVVKNLPPFKAKVKKLNDDTVNLLRNKARIERKVANLQEALLSILSYTKGIRAKMAENNAKIEALQVRQLAQRKLISERLAKKGKGIAKSNTSPLFLKKICRFYNSFGSL